MASWIAVFYRGLTRISTPEQDGDANPKTVYFETVWKKNIPFTHANFENSQFVSDGPKENYLVYALSL